MLKPTRTILALAAGSLVLGLVGAGTSVADEQPVAEASTSQQAEAAAMRHSIGKVVSKGPLKVRSKANTRSRIVGQVYPNRTVEIECKQYGESVDGNRVWYRLHDENDNNENGNNENGSDQNGSDQNGSNGNGTWPGSGNQNAGTGGNRGEDRAAYDHERWVSARYVKNLSKVRFCR
ncbi:SH3 domain-containing protein [Streptomyces sp. NPDC059193]|uniref:SH3 domain-containing protein n=1 Tax=Streptomyces sp. NPDC059193 TaxID=3346763 RepID=UPI0036C43BDC